LTSTVRGRSVRSLSSLSRAASLSSLDGSPSQRSARPSSRSDCIGLCNAGCRRGLSCRAGPRSNRHTRRGLATGCGVRGRDRRGDHGLGAPGALCPHDAGQGIAAGV
jgi:hypothetical protein